MTKREILTLIKTVNADNTNIVAYCDNEIAALDKKNEYRKAHPVKTKSQKEAETLIPTIVAILDTTPKSPTIIANEAGISVQRATAFLTKLVAENKAIKVVEKGKSFYTAVEA